MPEKKYEEGDVYGSLKVLAYTRERGYSQYRVRCENCGREFLTTASAISKYGCARCNKAQKEKEKIETLRREHVGKTYGNLTVIDVMLKAVTRGKETIRTPVAICRCGLCGGKSEFLLRTVVNGWRKACTCSQPEILKRGKKILDRGKIDGTNVYRLDAALNKNSTTGIKGVSYMPKYGKYRAYIMIGRKHIHLGMFSDIEDAKAARKEAEEKYFDPVKKQWKEQNEEDEQ